MNSASSSATSAARLKGPRPPGGHAVRGASFYVCDEDAQLGAVLRALPPLERTWLISSWATSESEPARRLLASALVEPLDAVGARWALDHLQRDPRGGPPPRA